MNKALTIVATTVLAASASALVASSASANERFWSGVKPSFGSPSPSPSYEAPAYRPRREREYTPEPRVQSRVKPVRTPVEKDDPPPVKYADGKGREYDQASKIWFDGKTNCWAGKQAWTYKSGSWFYGSSRWSQNDGNWQTNASDDPKPVDCRSVAVFAAKMPAVDKAAPDDKSVGSKDTQYSEGRGNASDDRKVSESEVPPLKTAEKPTETSAKPVPAPQDASSMRECKKYSASTGSMVSVPCDQ